MLHSVAVRKVLGVQRNTLVECNSGNRYIAFARVFLNLAGILEQRADPAQSQLYFSKRYLLTGPARSFISRGKVLIHKRHIWALTQL